MDVLSINPIMPGSPLIGLSPQCLEDLLSGPQVLRMEVQEQVRLGVKSTLNDLKILS